MDEVELAPDDGGEASDEIEPPPNDGGEGPDEIEPTLDDGGEGPDEIEPTLDDGGEGPDEIEPTPDDGGEGPDEIEPIAVEIEPIAVEIEPIAVEIEPNADEIGPIADEIGPNADEIGPIADEIELIADEIGPIADDGDDSADTIEPMPDDGYDSPDTIEPMSDDEDDSPDTIELMPDEEGDSPDEIEPSVRRGHAIPGTMSGSGRSENPMPHQLTKKQLAMAQCVRHGVPLPCLGPDIVSCWSSCGAHGRRRLHVGGTIVSDADESIEVNLQSPDLLVRCMNAAGVNQKGLAEILGISDRTLSRWLGGGLGVLSANNFHALARAIFPNDPAFAAELAGLGSTTLEALGLVRAPVAPARTSDAPISPPVVAPVISAALLDSIVCAAADLHDLPSRQVRPMVAAAFARAVELGLTAEAVASGFAGKPKKA